MKKCINVLAIIIGACFFLTSCSSDINNITTENTPSSSSVEESSSVEQINWIEQEAYRQQPESYRIPSELRDYLNGYFQSLYGWKEIEKADNYIDIVLYKNETITILELRCCGFIHILAIEDKGTGYEILKDISCDAAGGTSFSQADRDAIFPIMTKALQEQEKKYPIKEEDLVKVSEELKNKMFLPAIQMIDITPAYTETELEEMKGKMRIIYDPETSRKELAEYLLTSNGYEYIHDKMLAVTVNCDDVKPIEKEELGEVGFTNVKFIVYVSEEGEILRIIVNHEAM